MLKIEFKIKEGIRGTILFAFIFPISLIFVFDTTIRNGFFDTLAPLYFLIFLISPYLKRKSIILGGITGFIIYSLIIGLNSIILVVSFTIICTLILILYNTIFYKETEKKMHLIINLLILIITIIILSWIFSLTNSLAGYMYFYPSLQAYMFFGGLLSIVITLLLTTFYGVKINSISLILRQ